MGKFFFRMLVAGDVEHVQANMRQTDADEVTAALGEEGAKSALARSVMLSSHYWAIEIADEPVAVFGVAPVSLLGGIGCPWLLGTDRVTRRALVAAGRRYVPRMLGLYPHLVNYVDARNTRSVCWLARLGFEIHPPAPYGAARLPFHRFEKRA